METLIIILIVVLIAQTTLSIIFKVKDRHAQTQYDLVCRQLRQTNEEMVKREDVWRHHVETRDRRIEELSALVNQYQEGFKVKVTYPNGQQAIGEYTLPKED